MKILGKKSEKKDAYLAKPENFLSGAGPYLKTSAAVSANPKLGFFTVLQILCDVRTWKKKCRECIYHT